MSLTVPSEAWRVIWKFATSDDRRMIVVSKLRRTFFSTSHESFETFAKDVDVVQECLGKVQRVQRVLASDGLASVMGTLVSEYAKCVRPL